MKELNGIMQTMLIPLSIKANETKRKKARIQDWKAVEIIDLSGIDTTDFDKFMSHEGVVARTILFDRALEAYLKKYPDAVCINIGCGLDDRFSRVDNGRILWYDLDLPDVIAVRKEYFKEQNRVTMIGISALDSNWPDQICKGKKTILVIEGMLMYFTEKEVRKLFSIIKQNFPDSLILAELMAPFTVKKGKRHDTVKKTTAVFKWGIKDGKEAEAYCSGLKLVDEKSFNVEMKKHTIRGWLFGTLPGIRSCNNRIAVYHMA